MPGRLSEIGTEIILSPILNASDQPIRFTNGRGYTTTSTFNAQGKLTRITNPLGQTRSFTYDAFTQLTSVTDARGNTTVYRYDPVGNLAELVDALGQRAEMTYDAQGRRLSVTDKVGATTHYTFDPRYELPTAVRRADGTFRTVGYDGLGKIVTFTDENGHTTDYDRRPTGQLRAITDAKGYTSTFTFDGEGRIDSLTDARGFVTRYTYDRNNRRLTETDRTGAVMTSTYDANGQLATMTDDNGNTHFYTRDAVGRLLEDRLNPIEKYDYDANGNVIKYTDPNNNVYLYTYDAADRLITMTDPAGALTRYTYDGDENVLTVTDANNHVTTWTYDPLSRPLTQTDPRGGVTHFAWDAESRQTLETDANGHTTTAAYDLLGRMTSLTDPLGAVTRWTYDGIGNTAAATDPLGRVSQFVYDELDRVSSQTDPLGNTTRFEYDAEDNVLRATDALNRVTTWTYDGEGRPLTQTDALGGVAEWAYDGVGNVTRSTDELGRVWRYTYDTVDRLTTATDPLNKVTSFAYDDASNLTSMTDANSHTTQYGYDNLNRLIRTTAPDNGVVQYEYDPVGNLTRKIDELGYDLTWQYDVLDRVVRTTDESDGVQQFAYDAVGNVTRFTDELNRVWNYGYDNADRRTSSTDPAGSITRYAYDLAGQLTSVTDVVGNLTRWTYDLAGRMISTTDGANHTSTMRYDAVGNMVGTTDRNGRERLFGYDVLNRLTQEAWGSGAFVYTAGYAYDAVGNLVSANDTNSRYNFTYDARNRVTVNDNQGTPNVPHTTLSYQYDNVGNRTRTQDNTGVTINDTFDVKNRLTKRAWTGGGVAPVHVDVAYQQRDGITSINRYRDDTGTPQLVIAATMDYKPTHELTSLNYSNATGASLASYAYTFDAAGQLTREVDHGNTSNFSYDPRGQLTQVTRSHRATEVYAWDANGNPNGTGAVTAADNRATEDATYRYEYDAEGNRTKRTNKATNESCEYTYDYRNRLTNVVQKSASGSVLHSATYTYDVFDRLIVRTIDGVANSTVYDGDSVWADYNSRGQATARYLSGLRIDELWARWTPGNGTAWYLQDRMFSVRDIANSSGQIIDNLDYTAFGAIVSESNPSVGDRFKYTGREYDALTQLYWYRARWYDPATGKFTSQDSWGMAAGDTNLYRYGFNSPALFRDPSGHLSIIEYAVLDAIRPKVEFKTCISDKTVRIVFQWSAMAGMIQGEAGIVVANYGIPIPRDKQMKFCVESCADLAWAAYANGAFGVTAMSIDAYSMLGDGHGITHQQIEYREPDAASDQYTLRVSSECGRKELERLAQGKGPSTPPLVDYSANLAGNSYRGGTGTPPTAEGWTNPIRRIRKKGGNALTEVGSQSRSTTRPFKSEAERKAYHDGYERIFGPKTSTPPVPPPTIPNRPDLFRTGNTKRPSPVRPGKDITPDGNNQVHPTNPPQGLSTYDKESLVLTKGRLWRLPAESKIPDSLCAHRDNVPPGHWTMGPSRKMSRVVAQLGTKSL
jgi:RHS repeat-associated protein